MLFYEQFHRENSANLHNKAMKDHPLWGLDSQKSLALYGDVIFLRKAL